jgi:esterase
MQLHYHRSGQGRPLVVLHGLFGTWENLGASVRALAEHWDVIAPDLRNHGRSVHTQEHSYPLMAADLAELLDSLSIESVSLLGHSMGGKVAMEFALTYPKRVEKLIVVDIAPVEYPAHHRDVFAGIAAIDLQIIKSRSEADQLLSQRVESPGVRAFLLKNLYREEGSFRWRANFATLEREYAHIAAAPASGRFAAPTLFIKGANSNYLLNEYQQAVTERFTNVQLKIISDAGHWPHAEKPETFLRLVTRFLEG